MKKLAITFLLLISVSNIYSQNIEYISMAVRVAGGISTLKGLERSEVITADPNNNPSIGNRFAWEIGISFQSGLKNGFFLQNECNIGMLGASAGGINNVGEETKLKTINTQSFQICMYLGKKIAINENLRLGHTSTSGDWATILFTKATSGTVLFTPALANSKRGTSVPYWQQASNMGIFSFR